MKSKVEKMYDELVDRLGIRIFAKGDWFVWLIKKPFIKISKFEKNWVGWRYLVKIWKEPTDV